jgi:hypothetical protein
MLSKRYLIPIGLILLGTVILLIMSIIKNQNTDNNSGNPKISSYPTLITTFPKPTYEISYPTSTKPNVPEVTIIVSGIPYQVGVNTGVLETTLSPEEEKITNKIIELRHKTPIENSYFTINFDYTNDKFKINIKTPTKDNLLKYQTWIVENGYDIIPEGNFIINY